MRLMRLHIPDLFVGNSELPKFRLLRLSDKKGDA
jgi:hypothetical protein